MLEMMIAIMILSLIVTAIYSSWTAILRATKAAQESTASVQRARIVIRVLEDSLGSAHAFAANQGYYSFLADNGSDASLSFVARLAKSFPRSGKFGDFDVRRLTFSLEPGTQGNKQLVLRQTPLLLDTDAEEKEHPLVLAENVREFSSEFWDTRQKDWVDEWKDTNALPKLVKIVLRLSDSAHSLNQREPITRIISLPSIIVQPAWQKPLLQRTGTNRLR
jgi:type II secretion system protein J